MTDLTVSAIDRQNILNNSDILDAIMKYIGIKGLMFDGEVRFTRKELQDFYLIDNSTIDRYLLQHESELKHNGYVVLKGKSLKEFKKQFGWMLQEGAKAPQLSVFNFRSFLNLGMLLTESDRAKALRSAVLDIVIDAINKKTGGNTKYINQRDEDFIVAITREPKYRQEFTSALSRYLDMGNYKYSVYTDAIYKAIFKENAKEYKNVLKLEDQENPRDTMYSEVLTLIASFEIGIADEMRKESERLNRKLTPSELDSIIDNFSNMRLWEPQIQDARTKMASRDYGFRDIIHERLKPYIDSIKKDDYARFLGDKSDDLIHRVLASQDLIDVFKRLKDR